MKQNLILLFGMICFASANAQYDSLKPKGIYASNFIISETPRDLIYYMPEKYGAYESYPLLIVLLDDGVTATGFIKKWGDVVHEKADSSDCVIMYPETADGRWHLEGSVSNAASGNDISFLGIMINFFVQQYHCNADRIFFLGIGRGGNMSYLFHCESMATIAKIATINMDAGANHWQNCRQKNPVPSSAINKPGNFQSGINEAWRFLFSNK